MTKIQVFLCFTFSFYIYMYPTKWQKLSCTSFALMHHSLRIVTIHRSSRIMKTMLPPPLMHQKRLRLHQHQYFLCEMKWNIKANHKFILGLMGKIWTELGLDLNQWIIGLITFLANSVGVVLQVALRIGDIGKQSHLK